MAYSESLAMRVRQILSGRPGISEKKMFGGVCFLWHGHLSVGIWQQSLIARLGPESAAAALGQPDVREFDVTGRPMRGWVMIEPDGVESNRQLTHWLEQSLAFVGSLPPKEEAKPRQRRTKSSPPPTAGTRPARAKRPRRQ